MVKLLQINSLISSFEDKVIVRYETSVGTSYDLEYEACASLPNDSIIMGMLKDIEFPNDEYLQKVMKEIYNQSVVLIEDYYLHNNINKIIPLLKTDNAINKKSLISAKYQTLPSSDAVIVSMCNIFGKNPYEIVIKFDPCDIDKHEFFRDMRMDGTVAVKKDFENEDLAVEYILGQLGLRKVDKDPIRKVIIAEPIFKFVTLKSIQVTHNPNGLKRFSAVVRLNKCEDLIFIRNLSKTQSIDELYEILSSIKAKTKMEFLNEVRDSFKSVAASIKLEDVE